MKQHVVSNCYLKAWCDPLTPPGQEPFLWLISRDGLGKVKRAPKKSLTQTDVYTLKFDDGKTSPRVEKTLSQLETSFVQVQKTISGHSPLNPNERAYLSAFMAAMYSRTDPFARAMESAWSQLHERVKEVEGLIDSGERSALPNPIHPGDGTTISSKETRFLATNARPLAVESAIQMAAPLIWRMNMAFFQAPQGSFFVTF